MVPLSRLLFEYVGGRRHDTSNAPSAGPPKWLSPRVDRRRPIFIRKLSFLERLMIIYVDAHFRLGLALSIIEQRDVYMARSRFPVPRA